MRTLKLDGNEFVFEFAPFEPGFFQAKDAVKSLPGRKFDGNTKVWRVPANTAFNLSQVASVAAAHGFKVSPEAQEKLSEAVTVVSEKIEASRSLDSAPFEIPGLGERKPFPFQYAGIKYLVDHKTALCGDQMGLGKTGEAICAVATLKAFPCLVVCPASLKLNWVREWNIWNPKRKVAVLNGGKAQSYAAEVVVINYDILGKWAEHLTGFASVVFDESHMLKNGKAQRSKLAKQIAKSVPYKFLLTGTATLNKPVEIVHQLDVLGRLEEFGGWWNFTKRYCDAHQEWVGRGRWAKQVWNLDGNSNLDELNTRLRATCYVRREKKEVLTDLPEKLRAVVPVAMDREGRSHYDSVVEEIEQAISEAVEYGEDLPPGFHLSAGEKLRQAAVAGKLEQCFEWIDNFLESGEKLVVFGWHRSTVEAVAARYNCASITGDTPLKKRQEAIDAFQLDPSVRVIALNIQAGGVGITLTAASNVAFLEYPWRPGDCDQAEDRCHRIGQQSQVTAYYLAAVDTVEQDMAELIARKRAVTDQVNEGDALGDYQIVERLREAVEQSSLGKSPEEWRTIERELESAKSFFVGPATPIIQDGYYTVVFQDKSRVTLRIRRWRSKGDGSQIASRLFGPINTSDYRGFAVVRGAKSRPFGHGQDGKDMEALRVLLESPNSLDHAQAYAMASKRCWSCGRLLTTPESLARGIGPECAERLGANC